MPLSAPTSTDLPFVVAASLIGLVLIGAASWQLANDRRRRSLVELDHRRRNYLPLALVLGIAVFLIPDLVDETIPSHHIDEFIDYVLGAAALIWLFWPGLRFRPVPVWPLIAGLALLSNVIGIAIEHADPDDVGGDILTSALMALGIAYHLIRLRMGRQPKPAT